MQEIKLYDYIKRLLVVFIFFFIISAILTTNDVVTGFIGISFTALLSTILASKLLLRDKQCAKIIIITFIIKYLIGVTHFLFFYDANYFNSNGLLNENLAEDYNNYFRFISYLIDKRDNQSIFFIDLNDLSVTHPLLINIWAYFFQYFGNYALNVVPLNNFFSSIASISIYLSLNRYYRDRYYRENNYTRHVLWGIALFPLFLDNAIYVRDIIGQMFMSIGMCILILSNAKQRILTIVPVGILFMLQRDVYFLAAIILYLAIIYNDTHKIKSIIIPSIVLIFIYIAAHSFLPDVGAEIENKSDGTSITNIPLRILLGLIGPFPWFSFSERILESPVFSSQIYHYLAGTLHISMILCIILAKRIKVIRNPICITGIFIASMGILHGDMHITYVMAGTLYVFPCIYIEYYKYFNKSFFLALSILIFLNMIIAVTGNLGLHNTL